LNLEEKEYKGYNLFSHIQNPKLRAWNRCAMLFNTRRDGGTELSQNYLNELDDIGKAHVRAMLDDIRKDGYEATKKTVLKELNG
jgi:hypothetical protein